MIRKLLNFSLNFVMSILILGLICIQLISSTVFNKEYIKEKLKENRFYERSYSDIIEDFENYTMQSGLELEILDGLVSKEKVTSDINSKIDSSYSGEKVKIETDSIRTELNNRINLALEENNRVPSDDEKKSIQKYEDVITGCYQDGILYGKEFSIKDNYLKKAKNICLISVVCIGVVLTIINRNLFRFIANIGINLVFAGTLCISIRYLLEKRVIHILILDSKFSNFLVNMIVDIISKFYKVGIIAILIGFLLIIIGSLEKIKKTIENKKN